MAPALRQVLSRMGALLGAAPAAAG